MMNSWIQTKAEPELETLLVHPRAAAKMLCVSERTLYTRTQDGTIPCVRVGRLVRYRIETLKKFVAESEMALTKGMTQI
jgi:excisionase family DNA binding protein